MVKLSTTLVFLFLLVSGFFIAQWIKSPEMNWEPWATAISAVLIPLVFLFQKQIDSIFNDQGKVERINHDKVVFDRLGELINEDFAVRFVNETGGSARCGDRDKMDLEYFLEEVKKSNYSFLTKKIEKRKAELIESAIKVRNFLRYNFDSFDDPRIPYSRLCKPEENPYGNPEQYEHLNYDELFSMLNDLLKKMQNSYSAFRSEVKRYLYV